VKSAADYLLSDTSKSTESSAQWTSQFAQHHVGLIADTLLLLLLYSCCYCCCCCLAVLLMRN